MTPKEKAKELVHKYSCYFHGIDENLLKEVVIHRDAKQCALIAVDEIIKIEFESVDKLLKIISDNKIKLVMSLNENYWQEVKKEIINYE